MNLKKICLRNCIAATFLLLASSCEKEKTQPLNECSVQGYCFIHDTDGKKLPDHSGVKVAIDGTNLFAETTSDGKWNFEKLEPVNSSFAFMHDGFGTHKVVNKILNSAVVIVDTVRLYPMPECLLSVTHVEASRASLSVYATSSGVVSSSIGYRVFFDKKHDVSYRQGSFTFEQNLGSVGASGIEFMSSTENQLYKNGFDMGDTVYMVAYAEFMNPVSANQYQEIFYIDAEGNKVYSTLSPMASNTVSFILP